MLNRVIFVIGGAVLFGFLFAIAIGLVSKLMVTPEQAQDLFLGAWVVSTFLIIPWLFSRTRS
jgi:hypothetical protein